MVVLVLALVAYAISYSLGAQVNAVCIWNSSVDTNVATATCAKLLDGECDTTVDTKSWISNNNNKAWAMINLTNQSAPTCLPNVTGFNYSGDNANYITKLKLVCAPLPFRNDSDELFNQSSAPNATTIFEDNATDDTTLCTRTRNLTTAFPSQGCPYLAIVINGMFIDAQKARAGDFQIEKSCFTPPANTGPVINSVKCYNNSANYIECSLMKFGDNVTGIRVNVTDVDGGGQPTFVNITLRNPIANIIFNNSNSTREGATGDFWNTSFNRQINYSGVWNITTVASDGTVLTTNITQFNFTPASLATTMLTQSKNAIQNLTTSIESNFTAILGTANNGVEGILDPEIHIERIVEVPAPQGSSLKDTLIGAALGAGAVGGAIAVAKQVKKKAPPPPKKEKAPKKGTK